MVDAGRRGGERGRHRNCEGPRVSGRIWVSPRTCSSASPAIASRTFHPSRSTMSRTLLILSPSMCSRATREFWWRLRRATRYGRLLQPELGLPREPGGFLAIPVWRRDSWDVVNYQVVFLAHDGSHRMVCYSQERDGEIRTPVG